jgi:hypothetical protein
MIFNRFAILILLLSFSPTGLAEDNTGATSLSRDIDQEILQLQQSNRVYEKVIKNLIQRIEQLEDSVGDAPVIDTQEMNQPETTIDAEVKAQLQKESEENSRLIQTAFEQRLNKEGGMLLSKYQFIYEPSLSYAHSSYDKIVVDGFTVYPVLVVGDIVSEKVSRDIIINNHAFRFGLGHDTQIDVVIPLGYEKENAYREDGFHQTKKTSGLGDIALGLSHQLTKYHDDWPDIVVAFNWKTATGQDPYRLISSDELTLGSGFNTYGLSFTSMANADPVILFGGYSINYTHGEEKQIGYVKPGLSNGLNLGMVLALNFDTSLSFNFQFLRTNKTAINGQKINGSVMTTSTFTVGLSTAKGGSYAVDIDLGIGLTSDSPDFQLTVSFPFDFSFL